MYSFPNFEPVCCSISGSNCCFLTYVQIFQEAGKVVWYSYLLKNFPQFVVIHTVKDFSLVNETDLDVFLEFPCFFYNPMDAGNWIFGSSAFSKSSFYIWKFLVHILLNPSLKGFEHYLASTWNECNCMIVWTFFGIALLWGWDENWPFPVLWPLLSFVIYWCINCSNLSASSLRVWHCSTAFPSPPLALFIVMLPKTHLTSYLRMSEMNDHTTMVIWVIKAFLYSSSVYSCTSCFIFCFC